MALFLVPPAFVVFLLRRTPQSTMCIYIKVFTELSMGSRVPGELIRNSGHGNLHIKQNVTSLQVKLIHLGGEP